MKTRRHYRKAPITEAVIDLRVPIIHASEIEHYSTLANGTEHEYPTKSRLLEPEGVVEVRGVETGVATGVSAKSIGYRFVSADGRYVCQNRMNGLTLSRLQPYENWEPFRDEARKLWERFRERFHPETVTRLALRYINRIDIRAERIDLKDYFRTLPEVSPELPQTLRGFFMQVRLPERDLNAEAVINQMLAEPAERGAFSIILDIDLFQTQRVPDSEDLIWGQFEKLHDRKNEIFEACITDKTRETFQ